MSDPALAAARREAGEALRNTSACRLTHEDNCICGFGPLIPALRSLLAALLAALPAEGEANAPTLTERKEKDYEDARCEAHSLLRSLAPELAPHKSLAVEITQISDAVAGLRGFPPEVERLRKALGYITDISEANACRAIVEMKRLAHEALDSAPAEEEGRDA